MWFECIVSCTFRVIGCDTWGHCAILKGVVKRHVQKLFLTYAPATYYYSSLPSRMYDTYYHCYGYCCQRSLQCQLTLLLSFFYLDYSCSFAESVINRLSSHSLDWSFVYFFDVINVDPAVATISKWWQRWDATSRNQRPRRPSAFGQPPREPSTFEEAADRNRNHDYRQRGAAPPFPVGRYLALYEQEILRGRKEVRSGKSWLPPSRWLYVWLQDKERENVGVSQLQVRS